VLADRKVEGFSTGLALSPRAEAARLVLDRSRKALGMDADLETTPDLDAVPDLDKTPDFEADDCNWLSATFMERLDVEEVVVVGFGGVHSEHKKPSAPASVFMPIFSASGGMRLPHLSQ
jgi:hypothetical protein